MTFRELMIAILILSIITLLTSIFIVVTDAAAWALWIAYPIEFIVIFLTPIMAWLINKRRTEK